MIYIVTYELSDSNEPHPVLTILTEQYETVEIHTGVRLVSTEFDTRRLRNSLSKFLKRGEKIFVCPLPLEQRASAGLRTKTREWMRTHCEEQFSNGSDHDKPWN